MAETVSVLAPDATEADALSTAIFVGGPALAEKLVQNRNDLGVLYLPANGPLRLFGCKSDCFQLK
jgi:thiamine biosynthesis lipoprotein ApbE